ncbi:N-acetylmuramoyl-L-alanine amidase [Streptomyces sp. ISL-98]|uniref:N-acetylmuramoyl-L-alanine amidase n=1 Tax=Streptomyces sp. ISL-98 TaxID=2819192 RepID=UPI0027E4C97E|nr:N-acetylmuramoyl-L-alanine amidase [Streptomyces sp. ISL-98]
MASPMAASQLAAILRAEGLTVVEVGNWETHNRNHKGPWGPVHGVMIHHTVTSGTANSVALCRDGHSSLPGPLCHGVIDKQGVIHLVGYGRTNHAGLGDGDVLQAVIDETALPADNETDTDGNRHFYGFECINLGDGADPWPSAQLDAIERASAAICRHHGWGAGSVIGHLEWQPGKVDPRGFTMQTMRGRVAARLDNNQPPEDDMALSADDKTWIKTAIADGINTHAFKAVVQKDAITAPKDAPDTETNPTWRLDSYEKDTNARTRATQKTVTELAATVGQLETVGLTDAQMARLADLVADKLAARLAN